MAQTHGQLLKQFHVTGASLSWPDVQCVCAMFPMVEDLSVLIFTNDIVSHPTLIANSRLLNPAFRRSSTKLFWKRRA